MDGFGRDLRVQTDYQGLQDFGARFEVADCVVSILECRLVTLMVLEGSGVAGRGAGSQVAYADGFGRGVALLQMHYWPLKLIVCGVSPWGYHHWTSVSPRCPAGTHPKPRSNSHPFRKRAPCGMEGF